MSPPQSLFVHNVGSCTPLRLKARDVSCARSGRTILSGLDFEVAGGEALVLTGANGAGKTTLLRTIAGFMPPARGEITLDGADPDGGRGESCHYVAHANGLRASLTVGENLRFWQRFLTGQDDGKALDAALRELTLETLAGIPAGLLSAGQKRRVALARLLTAHRPVWLLDEPTASLDSASQQSLTRLMARHLAASGLIVVATHLPLGLTGARELRLGRERVAA